MTAKQKENLTSEYLTKHFPDNFSLAITAIASAKHLIASGKEFRLTQLLDSVARGKIREEQERVVEEASKKENELTEIEN